MNKDQNRITKLESEIMHLDHKIDQLNDVILKQQAELDAINKKIQHLQANFERLDESPEERDPAEERPPHY